MAWSKPPAKPSNPNDDQLFVNIGSAIVPKTADVALGTQTRPFKDLFVGAHSIYVDGNQVISSNQTTINITTDIDQHLSVSTSGLGTTRIASTKEVILYSGDDVNIEAVGDVSVRSKGRISFQADALGQDILFETKSNLGDIKFKSIHSIQFDAPSVMIRGKEIMRVGDSISGSLIAQDSNYRLVSDADTTRWNAKSIVKASTNGNLLIDGVDTKVYQHPATHPASMIDQDETRRFVSDTLINTWNLKSKVAKSTTPGHLLIDDVDVTIYEHPTGDGNLHVPPTSTTSGGRVLKAGTSAGSISWGKVDLSETTGILTEAIHGNLSGGPLHAVATTSISGFMHFLDKVKLDGISNKATRTEVSSVNGNLKIDGNEFSIYTHPSTHAAAMIVTDSIRRFVSDAQISSWNLKESTENKNMPSGYAGLDASGKILLSLLPDTAKAQTYIVADETERLNLKGMVKGDRAFEKSTSLSYIWDGTEWFLTSSSGGGTVSWADITNRPSSTTQAIDTAVSQAHIHTNQLILDSTTASFTTALKTKLDQVRSDATKTEFSVNNGKLIIDSLEKDVYLHPDGDGNLHVPATGTQSNGKVLTAGSTAGSMSWKLLNFNMIQYDSYISDLQHGSRSGGTLHAEATTTIAGFMSASDKSKLDDIDPNANHYVHPVGDGNLHVPATGTASNGKYLKAGDTAGIMSWTTIAAADISTDSANRFVSDTQIASWTDKQDALGYTPANKAGDTFTGAVRINAPLNLYGTLNVNGMKLLELQSNSSDFAALNPFFYALRQGKSLYPDEEFAVGFNGVNAYNNSDGTDLVAERVDYPGAPNSTGKVMRVTHNGGIVTPYLGGFRQYVDSKPNGVFVQMFKAKLPVGYSFIPRSNSMGTGSTDYFLSDVKGTGKWEYYVRVSINGPAGTFSSSGHVAVDGTPVPTAESPLVWYIASAAIFDLTNVTQGHGSNIDADKIDGKESSFFLDAGNLETGILRSGRFTDTSHGQRSGGDLHAKATAALDGFMSKEHFSKVEGIEAKATATAYPVISDTEPTTNLKEGLVWYAPQKDETKIYLNGSFRNVSSADGTKFKTSRLESVYIAMAGETLIPLNIDSYNPVTDMLDVYYNNVPMMEDYNWTFDPVTRSVEFDFPAAENDMYNFHVWKQVDATSSSVDGKLLNDNSVSDVKIGERTIDDTYTPTGNALTLNNALSGLANRIKSITGGSSWTSTPVITLKNAVDKTVDGTFSGKMTFSKGILINGSGTSNRITLAATGYGPPLADETKSIGSKIELWRDYVSFYGLGVDASTLWYNSHQNHVWYSHRGSATTMDPKVEMVLNGYSGNLSLGTSGAIADSLNGRTYLTIKGRSNSGVLELTQTLADAVNMQVGQIQFTDFNSISAEKRVAGIAVHLDGTTSNNRGGRLSFYTKPDGGGSGYYLERGGFHHTGRFFAQQGADINGNAEVLGIAGTDHVYMGFYPKGMAAGRKAWLGFGNPGSEDMYLVNQGSGTIGITVNGYSSVTFQKDGLAEFWGSIRLSGTSLNKAGLIDSPSTVTFSNGTQAQGIYVKSVAASFSWDDNNVYGLPYGIYSYGGYRSQGNMEMFVRDPGGNIGIQFISKIDRGSDSGSITYYDHNSRYAFWGSTYQNGALVIAVGDDGPGTSSDVLAFQATGAIVVDADRFRIPTMAYDPANAPVGCIWIRSDL